MKFKKCTNTFSLQEFRVFLTTDIITEEFSQKYHSIRELTAPYNISQVNKNKKLHEINKYLPKISYHLLKNQVLGIYVLYSHYII